jgi:hypothetical protein
MATTAGEGVDEYEKTIGPLQQMRVAGSHRAVTAPTRYDDLHSHSIPPSKATLEQPHVSDICISDQLGIWGVCEDHYGEIFTLS